ncbi:MAG: GntR family transcriptional regulator [Tissierella sp.]|uniref:GntR family transcriptional regulator n=1 Tax=Tissierella sp. TaxID=41274 RepID=UPI003F948140
MDFKDNLPIYIQIMNYIKREIITKNIKEGGKLPSVRELSSTLTVNPNTIQRAYAELEREELVFTQRGMGTFATEDVKKIENLKREMAKELVDNFLIEMQSLNFTIEEIKNLID